MNYDVFNGDADGICSLIQLRFASPKPTELITGVKRDISLLARVPITADADVTVLDISLDKNRDALVALLDAGASIAYFDHHFAGEIPEHENLFSTINVAPEVCTAILVNSYLNNQFLEWAVVGAFGDNLHASAMRLAKPLALGEELPRLERLGVLINYNGYGASASDLHFKPEDLYRILSGYQKPQSFLDAEKLVFEQLESGYKEDLSRAQNSAVLFDADHALVKVLPDENWARRVSGVFGNQLANEHPDRAHAVVTEMAGGGYLVSLRAPLNNRVGADEICRQFPTGGGRQAAAGINDLPADQLDEFVSVFQSFYGN